jgi:sulfoxide reductase heme-binding subunit YedZ
MNQRPAQVVTKYPFLKPGVFVGALVPFVALVSAAARGTLGADPIAIALNRLGLTALILLVATLAATPARVLLGLTWPMRIRKLLGLMAFFYAACHALLYAVIDQGLSGSAIVRDVLQRKFITAGFLALVLLVPLAITSLDRIRRRMGGVRWQRLHRLIYPASLLAVAHFVWRVKRDVSQPAIYAAVLALLLLARVYTASRRVRRTRAT